MSSPYLPILAKLAIRRQADIDDATFLVYIEDLTAEGLKLGDVEAACNILGKQPRDEFQAAFPAIGDLLQVIYRMRANRLNTEQNRELARIDAAYRQRDNLSPAESKAFIARLRADVDARRT